MKYQVLSMGIIYLDFNCFDFSVEKGFVRNKEATTS